MGNKPEARFDFIQERAEFATRNCWTSRRERFSLRRL